MWTLSIQSRYLVLDGNFSPTITIKNPAWSFDEIPAALGLGLEVPQNEVNNNVLGFPGRFSKRAKSNDRRFSGTELRWKGFLFMYGTLVVTQVSSGSFSCQLQSELRTLSDAQREKYLGDYTLGGELTFENKTNYDPDTDLYCTIKLANAGFWKDKGTMADPFTKTVTNLDGTTSSETVHEEDLTKQFDDTVEFMVNANNIAGVKASSEMNETIVVSPFPFLHQLIRNLLKENKFFLKNYFLASDDVMKTLALYNNYSICQGNPIKTIKTIYIPGGQSGYYDRLPVSAVVDVIDSFIWSTTNFKLPKLLPVIKMPELLLSTQNMTNSFFHFKGIDDVDNISRESIFSMTPFDLSPYQVGKWRPGTRNNKVLKFTFEHDPDDDEFNQAYTDLSSREDDIKDPVDTHADLLALADPDIGEIRLVTSENFYYEYRITKKEDESGNDVNILQWEEASIGLQTYFYNKEGNETEEIKTTFSTLRMSDDGHPQAYQKGNSLMFVKNKEKFTPRLLFYNGNNTGGDKSSSGLSIDWKSLVPVIYKKTAPFYANALEAEGVFRIPGNIMYRILQEIYRPFISYDGNFLIKELSEITGTGEYLDVTMTVFKEEDNIFETTVGTVDGTGQHDNQTFTPILVGVSSSGHPWLIDADGHYRDATHNYTPPSSSAYAEYNCFAWDPSAKQLFIGSNSGNLTIVDLSDPDNVRSKTIQVFLGGNVSGIGLVNGIILMAQDDSAAVYQQPYHAVFDDYATGQSSPAGSLTSGYMARSFIYRDGYYYCCTQAGEVFRNNDLANNWTQLFDIRTEFTFMLQTANRLFALSTNDRNHYADAGSPTSWHEFGLLNGANPTAIQGAALTGDELLIIAQSNGLIRRMLDNNSNTDITPGSPSQVKGVCFDGAKYAYISMKDSSGFNKLAQYNTNVVIPEALWSYQTMPDLFSRLFMY